MDQDVINRIKSALNVKTEKEAVLKVLKHFFFSLAQRVTR